ncbi:sensor histidine kinase [Melioribacter sp. Ez-97]|uniref:sensor histidine kinase n=1 Tax=Melioribacter sp. Ez-97 TaxID=3423434 RepID=UPI003EDA9070
MKRTNSLLYIIIAFVIAQIAWLGLLALWIYWYVTNYIIFEQVASKLSPLIDIQTPNVFVFAGGIILIVGIAVVMFIFFRNLTVQYKLANLYDNFIAAVTHELKSPLSSLKLFLETMTYKNVSEEKRKDFLTLMTKDVNRLDNLINTILEISRLEQKKIVHDRREYKACELFEELIKESVVNLSVPEGVVNYECSSVSFCSADKKALQIAVNNLIGNALKYSASAPSIKVSVKDNGKKIIVDISDNGIGIPQQYQKKIFNKFFRVNSDYMPNVKGTGLGLYWTKEIIKQHKGSISVRSEGLNKGSTFRIVIPAIKNKG